MPAHYLRNHKNPYISGGSAIYSLTLLVDVDGDQFIRLNALVSLASVRMGEGKDTCVLASFALYFYCVSNIFSRGKTNSVVGHLNPNGSIHPMNMDNRRCKTHLSSVSRFCLFLCCATTNYYIPNAGVHPWTGEHVSEPSSSEILHQMRVNKVFRKRFARLLNRLLNSTIFTNSITTACLHPRCACTSHRSQQHEGAAHSRSLLNPVLVKEQA